MEWTGDFWFYSRLWPLDAPWSDGAICFYNLALKAAANSTRNLIINQTLGLNSGFWPERADKTFNWPSLNVQLTVIMQYMQNVAHFPPVLNCWYNLPHMVDALIQISRINLNLTPGSKFRHFPILTTSGSSLVARSWMALPRMHMEDRMKITPRMAQALWWRRENRSSRNPLHQV